MALIATMVALLAPAQAQAAVPVYLPSGCGHVHKPAKAKRKLRAYVRSDRPWLTSERVRHLRRCVSSHADRRALTRLTRRFLEWRQRYGPHWRIVFRRLPAWQQNWAWSTGACESGNNPATNTGNGYYGAFQFLPTTWSAAGGTEMPHWASWHHQAVIAVRWMLRAGASQWPVCG